MNDTTKTNSNHRRLAGGGENTAREHDVETLCA